MKVNTFKDARQDLSLALAGLQKISPAYHALLELWEQSAVITLRQRERLERRKIDEGFLVALEKGIRALTRIVEHPRSVLKDEEDLVAPIKAKKVGRESIQHLAAHSQYIQSVDESDRLSPEKVLTLFSEAEEEIYENRFIYSLLRRAEYFLNKRIEFIASRPETQDSDVFFARANFQDGEVRYRFDTRLEVSSKRAETETNGEDESSFKRLKELLEIVRGLLASPFALALQNSGEITSPLHMTNLLLKSPDYQDAIALWDYLEMKKDLGVAYEVDETEQHFDAESAALARDLMLHALLVLSGHMVQDRVIHNPDNTEHKELVPEVTISLEDEVFQDSKFLYSHLPLSMPVHEDKSPLSVEEIHAYNDEVAQVSRDTASAGEIIHQEVVEAKKEADLQEIEERRANYEELVSCSSKPCLSPTSIIAEPMKKRRGRKKKR